RARASSDVRRRHLALRRNAARARFVVVARPHPPFRARALVAASRRGENPAERFTRVYGIHAPGQISSGSVRVVESTRRAPVRSAAATVARSKSTPHSAPTTASTVTKSLIHQPGGGGFGPDQRQLEPIDELVAQDRGAEKGRVIRVEPGERF